MSYDFSLRIPNAPRKRKSGPRPEQLERLQRARDILLAFEPELEIDDGEGRFTARSAELGDVYVQFDRIWLGMSMGSEPRRVYSAIHGLMKRFHSEGYEAYDPQLGSPIVYTESFAEFMRQYRAQFRCNDEEFEQWCRGETPPAWAERLAVRERGDALAAAAIPRDFPLDWHQQKALSDDALWDHLQDTIRRNDAAIAEHQLGDYLQALSYAEQHAFPLGGRRVDGTWYPSWQIPWYQGSLLHYEAMLLGSLKQRGYPKAVRDQPQLVTVFFERPADEPINQAHLDTASNTMRPIYPILKAQGLIHYDVSATGQGNTWAYELYGEDADAIGAALLKLFEAPERYQPTRMVKRYGEVGAREEEVACTNT